MVASERIVVMVTPHEKKEISRTAKRFGINVSELVRRAVRGFQPPQEEPELEALLLRVNASTKEANEALDDALRFVQESNRRIDAMPAGGK
ncbi:MAG: plasmid mobilization protein [Burkholderiales bacterium]